MSSLLLMCLHENCLTELAGLIDSSKNPDAQGFVLMEEVKPLLAELSKSSPVASWLPVQRHPELPGLIDQVSAFTNAG